MTFGEFQRLVRDYARFRGQAYIDHDEEIGAFRDACNAGIREFCARARILFDDSVTMTLTEGEAVYSLRDRDVFSREMLFIDVLRVDNGTLDGPVPFHRFQRQFPGFRDASSSRPRLWVAVTPKAIRLYPAPDSEYEAFASGWYIPDYLEDDGDELDLPEEHHHGAAKLAALRILEVSMVSANAPAVLALRQDVEAHLARGKVDSSVQHSGPAVRGRNSAIVIEF